MVALLRKALGIVVGTGALARRGPRLAVAVGLGLLALVASACGTSGSPALEVSAAQAAVPLAGSSQLVLSITNAGDGDDALVGVETDAALAIELHETRIAEDRATMVSLDEVPLPAGQTVRFRPGGLHLMMIAPSDEVALGTTFEVTLRFDRSDPVTTTAEVRELLVLAEDSFDDPAA